MAAIFAYIAGAPFVLMTLYGVTHAYFGWFFGVTALGMVVATQLNSRLLRRFSFQTILRTATTIMTLTGFYLVVMAGFHAPFWLFAPALFLLSVCWDLCCPIRPPGRWSIKPSMPVPPPHWRGTLQFAVASFSTYAVSVFHDGTSIPMAVVMTLMVATALALCRWATAVRSLHA